MFFTGFGGWADVSLDMTENELSRIAVEISLDIHRQLGPGLLESVYEAAFCHELELRGIEFKQQEPIPVHYRGTKLLIGFKADIIMEDKLLIEIKSLSQLDKTHHKTVLTYLKLTGLKLGLLINFNVNLIKEGIHRKILGELYDPRLS
jgi:GxxExxY protein